MQTPLAEAEGPIRLCFLSYRHLSRLARSVIEEYGDRAQFEVIDESFEAALAIARARERSGTIDAFVSAGANASFLRGSLSTPVAVIKVTGYDIMLAMLKAREITRRVGVVSYRQTVPELDQVRDLLRVEVAQKAYRTPAEAQEAVRELAAHGYPVVIGSSIVCESAEKEGLTAILSYSLSSVRQGIEDALELGRVARLERARYAQLDGVLQSLEGAVLAVDRRHRIVALNTPMERVLGGSRAELLGQPLDRYPAELSLLGTLESGEPDRGEVIRVARRDWVRGRSAIRERGQITGAVLTLQDARSIREADTSLRSQKRKEKSPAARYSFADLKGSSPALQRARETARRFAATDITVLISGESGTGKELFAQAIHSASRRADRPFVAVNCSAFPETLLESELFGYEEGAFSGSRRGGKPGLFEAAHTGTLFLDEIGDMAPPLQTRLLRALQEREIVRLGGVGPIPVDVRIIAATHQPLDLLIQERRFRSDLYYRINILRLQVPPLRDRAEDVEELASTFLARCLRRLGSTLDPELFAALLPRLVAYRWPGNVRELENLCERLAVLLAHGQADGPASLEYLAQDCPELFALPQPPPAAGSAADWRERLDEVLAETGGRRQETARRLGISRATLWRHMQELERRAT
ncbi:propionate catabolism operon regulatory protein PrpR [Enterovirga aerilata]|uniref:Propionate catabolism operon regulatory protein PrpR n=1 Tax=Enterovirga aerilata TaxID=2730920 RepID=A0A849I6U1_9HYPH|nr:propionate catabolism operon regulatory protein PrpR [Enterovirga sp. DB1703]NNM73098.1 propionate catabolism operon regulatory protein PrpR [Enterovirga sp. DB1703]